MCVLLRLRLFRPFGFLEYKNFKWFGFESTRWRWFQKHVLCTNLISVFFVFILKLRFSSLRHRWPYYILTLLFRPFGVHAPEDYLIIWLWASPLKVFQKHVVCTKFDTCIYVFTCIVVLFTVLSIHGMFTAGR